jgi:protein involved in polysaccharide export with SLBB domain
MVFFKVKSKFHGDKLMKFFQIIVPALCIALILSGIAVPISAQEDAGQSAFGFDAEMLQQRFQSLFRNTYVDPEEYIVGPGDKIGIFFTSDQITDVRCEINTGGALFIKSVGRIDLGYITLAEAIEKVSSRVRENYANAEFAVQLTGFRIVRVNITGEVERPGIYYAPAIWRTSEVIDMAGGYTVNALIREIVLRGFGREYRADIISYQALGDPKNNPLICKGNVIEVPHRNAAGGYISISGRVNRPGTFTFVDGDCLGDLIAFAGDVDGNAADMEIVISLADGVETGGFDGASEEALDRELSPGDNVNLVWKKDRKDFGTVDIFGAVRRPGKYKISKERFTLKDLLQLCGGAGDEGCEEMIRIYRQTRSQDLGEASTDLNSPRPNGNNVGVSNISYRPPLRTLISLNPRRPPDPSGLRLIDGDSLYIPYATGMVSVTGAVVSPGLVRHVHGKGVEYYIREAGGPGFDADKNRAVVISPLTGARIRASRADKLLDGEILYIPRKESKARP